MSHKTQDSVRDQAVLNRVWSRLILEELTRLGVAHVCIAPGSRSTPLTLEADLNKALTIHTHFDERGLGFLALGMAKASQQPVAVIVTSGTAVANLLPAIAEAKLTGERIVVLSADRPVDLIDCGANQAINQTGLFSQHVVDSLNLPSPSEQVPATWLLSSIDKLMYRQCDTAGPVHINCPFPEPLYGEQDTSRFESYLAGVQKTKNGKKPYTARHRAQVTALDAIGNIEKKKGLIVVGSVDISDAEHAKMLADALGWPVLCDPQSGTSSLWQHYDLWLRSDVHRDTLAQCDLILQFGGRIVSKTLNRFIKQQAQQGQTDYYLVCQDEQPLNPDHLPQRQLFANTTLWVHNQLDALGCDVGQATNLNLSIESSEHSQWASKLKEVSKKTKALVQEVEAFSELGMAMSIPGIIRRGDLFIGNSLIVRLLDMVAALEGNRTYSNRGASGIDGLVATAAGVQRIHQEPLFMVLGDTSMLYDLNSLALFSDTDMTSVILVINNDGGAIFDLLPVPAEKRKNLYQMPHGFQFKYAAKQFGLKYLRPDSMDELIGVAIEHLESGKGALLVELETRSGQASQDINTLVQEVNALR